MENNKCPKCGKIMEFDIELEYDHSPYHCNHCGYAEGCSNYFSEEECHRCTEYTYCKRWHSIENNKLDFKEPVCKYCGRTPKEIAEYTDMIKSDNTYKDEIDFVKQQEGTYDYKTNTFVCTSCYVKHELLGL